VASRAFAPRAAAASIVTLLALIAGPGCEDQIASHVNDSASPGASASDPASSSPASELQVQTFAIASRDELVRRLGDLGWEEIIVFPSGDPESIEIWGGDDHRHARTHYVFAGRRIGVTQAGIGGLPPVVRPGSGANTGSDRRASSTGSRGSSWSRSGPGQKELAARLEWVPVAT
jgi:hypothetical protein